jgi:hypothetical protein
MRWDFDGALLFAKQYKQVFRDYETMSFKKDRDNALEEIHKNLLRSITNISAAYLDHIIDISEMVFRSVKFFTNDGRVHIEHLKYNVSSIFERMAKEIANEMIKTNDLTMKFVSASELEYIARVKDKTGLNIEFNQIDPKKKEQTTSRVMLSLEKIKSKFLYEIERAYAQENTDIKFALFNVMPEFKRLPKKKTLVRESEDRFVFDKKKDMSQTFMSNDEWRDVEQLYKDEYIPRYRNYKTKDGKFVRSDNDVYAWEIEQKATDEWLQSVRDGTNKAAKEAGVEDLMWIAFLDDKTRHEHERRDGLTSTEIEDKLKNDPSWKDDPYGSIAPSGFNCRCRSVPYIPEADDKKAGDFSEWMQN